MSTTADSPAHVERRRLPRPLRHRHDDGRAAVASSLESLRSGMVETVVAAEVAAAHAHDVSEAAHRVSGRVSEVSLVVEQLEESVAEISRSTHEAAGVVDATARASALAVEQLHRLEAATDEIGSMVDFINSIAEQTDLLALNATIEAARAGESGRGFGVVAAEVKELARATAEATGKINAVVERLRIEADSALGGVNEIAHLVDEFNARHTSIASAVEEQATATVDITQSLASASADITEVADGIVSVAAQAYEATVAASVAKQTVVTLTADLRIDLPPASNDDPLLAGLAAHSDWKSKLVTAIETSSRELSVATVRADDQCAFGKWLHGSISPADRAAAQYTPAVRLHATFHQCAADVLDLAQRSQREAALAAIAPGSDYASVSAELASVIVDWRASWS